MALFNRQKADKPKKQESIIGKIIYGFLLFMPLLAVGVACFYVMFNKNAYQSYSSTSVQNATLVSTSAQQIQGQTYLISYNDSKSAGSGASDKVSFSYCTADFTEFNSSITYTVTGYRIHNTGSYIYLYDENDTQHNVNTTSNKIKEVLNGQTLVYTSGPLQGSATYKLDYYLLTYTKASLDNVFYYQMEKLEQSDLFNWTKNTGTYTVMHTTTSQLGITNTYTPMIMTYWLIISIIYFLFDIALILIWAVHDKIHALKDAI